MLGSVLATGKARDQQGKHGSRFRLLCYEQDKFQDDEGVRQQFNSQSSFLDADNVYGYSEQRAKQVEFTQFLIRVRFLQNEILCF